MKLTESQCERILPGLILSKSALSLVVIYNDYMVKADNFGNSGKYGMNINLQRKIDRVAGALISRILS